MENKKVVHYERASVFTPVKIGERAVVVPVDHTSHFVRNGEAAITSRVVAIDETTGTFETANSIYVPTDLA